MKAPITPKSIALWFLIVLGLYLGCFYSIEYLNRRKGPWQLEFVSDARGQPRLIVNHSTLNIRDVNIVFRDEQVPRVNLSEKVLLERPLTSLPGPAPFGEIIYEDLRSLPGVVTFNFFGHEVELLPRVLIANKKEVSWRSGMELDLYMTNKPAQPPKPPKGWGTAGSKR